MSHGFCGTASAASMLDISESAVRRLIDRGTLPAVWVDGRRIIRMEAIRALQADEGYQRRSRARRVRQA
jgi:hypothetical protein